MSPAKYVYTLSQLLFIHLYHIQLLLLAAQLFLSHWLLPSYSSFILGVDFPLTFYCPHLTILTHINLLFQPTFSKHQFILFHHFLFCPSSFVLVRIEKWLSVCRHRFLNAGAQRSIAVTEKLMAEKANRIKSCWFSEFLFAWYCEIIFVENKSLWYQK